MITKGLLYRLLAMALSVALVLVAGELLLRLFGSGRNFVGTAVQYAGSRASFRLPDFRDRPRPDGKAASCFRILVVGDSFVWGVGVYPEDTYARRLERRLSSLASELEFEVVSWARSGWNTSQAWRSLRGRLASLDPDLVLLNFTLNDPEPSDKEARQRMMAPLHRREPHGWSRALHRRSALYRLFWERFENRRQRRAFVSFYQRLFTGPHWQDCLQAMEEMREATGARAIPLVLVVMPVFDSQLDRRYSYRWQHGKIAAAAAEREIPVLDLLETLRRVDARRLAVEPFTDPHPNELAHRIIADEITNYLLDEGLVPAAYPPGQPRVLAVRRR
jgi:lysophospholipase L1-like esterase